MSERAHRLWVTIVLSIRLFLHFVSFSFVWVYVCCRHSIASWLVVSGVCYINIAMLQPIWSSVVLRMGKEKYMKRKVKMQKNKLKEINKKETRIEKRGSNL